MPPSYSSESCDLLLFSRVRKKKKRNPRTGMNGGETAAAKKNPFQLPSYMEASEATRPTQISSPSSRFRSDAPKSVPPPPPPPLLASAGSRPPPPPLPQALAADPRYGGRMITRRKTTGLHKKNDNSPILPFHIKRQTGEAVADIFTNFY